ncbi:hypothetical protein [Arthrobacter sp. NicSoilC12]|uniref:hypothetical protein n=1 Tax=Arthrobacter sp. NicSoilC12 TaxID=2831001 RepID=UPI001CC48FF7|nr:hypothetical protein [Arthrobacter sp. NicSoilC12]
MAIPGATDSTYVPVPGDLAASFTVQVTGTRTGYITVARTSAATAPVAAGWAAPTISGTASFGSTLTAVPGSGGPTGVTLGYQWYRSGVAIDGATAATYVLVNSDYSSFLTVQVSASRPGHPTESRTSLPTARVTRATLVWSRPTITGTAKAGSTLTVDPGTWGPSPLIQRYWWSGSGPGRNKASYLVTGADAGKTLTVQVSGTKLGYYYVLRTSAPTAVVQPGTFSPAPIPTVTGTHNVGSTLTADPGVWGPDDRGSYGPVPVTLKYQWYRSGVAIVGATASAYVPVARDTAATLTVQVTGSRIGYDTLTRASAATAPVTAGWEVPVITGTASVGSTLTAVPGSGGPTGATLGYQWYRSGVALDGATAATYVPVAADVSENLTVQVIASRPGCPTESRTSIPTAAVIKGTLARFTPTITGTARAGSTLTVDPGRWGPSPLVLRYSWTGSNPVANKASYVVTGEDAGKALTVTVSGTRLGYFYVLGRSAPTAVVADGTFSPAPVPIVTGTAAVGSTLTADPGVWGPDEQSRYGPVPVTLKYQWYRSGVAIVGATASTYVPVARDTAGTLAVRVTGTRTGYNTLARASAATAPVAAGWEVPTITGTASVGSTLTAVPGSGSPTPVTLGYQWYRSGVAVDGATAPTYVPVASDLSATFTVQVTASRPGYATDSRTSIPTAAVIKGTLVGPTPRIIGSARVGSTLTVDPGTWGPSPLKLRYLWSGSNPERYKASYVVTGADAGTTLRVTVTGIKLGYFYALRRSAPTAVVPPGAFGPAPVPTATASPSPSASPMATAAPTATATATATASPSASRTPSASPPATSTTSRTPIPDPSASKESPVAATVPAAVGKGHVEPQASVQTPLTGTQFDSAAGTGAGYPAVESPEEAAIPAEALATPDAGPSSTAVPSSTAAPGITATPSPSAKPSEPVASSASQASNTASFPLLLLVLTICGALVAGALVWFGRPIRSALVRRRGPRAGG